MPRPIHSPAHPERWNELTWPGEYPLAMNEMSFLLPHLLKDGRGKLDVYFTRVYNPVWTNPDGFSWIEALTDESLVGLHVALTPTWSETAFFADYVLPMGHGSERHDIHSYEQYDGQWIGFRQPVLRAARERLGERVADTREVNPGEVWEENEFWIELSWRIDPDGALGIRRHFESRERPGEKLDRRRVLPLDLRALGARGCPSARRRRASRRSSTCAATAPSRSRARSGRATRSRCPAEELEDTAVDAFGRVYTRAAAPAHANVVPLPTPDPDAEGRRPVGVLVDGDVLRGFPTPSGRLEFYSRTLADWGWPEHALPGHIESHVHPDRLADGELTLISTFRLPVQIHTRSGNAKWLDEIAHTNPLWIHPADAARARRAHRRARARRDRDRPLRRQGVGHRGNPPRRRRLQPPHGPLEAGRRTGQRQAMATVDLARDGERWQLHRRRGVGPFESADPDTARIWWTDVGVHQNLTFPVHPDPISGMHCWHQAVRVRAAEPGDAYGDIAVDTDAARAVYRRWLELTRPAESHSPDGTRRPYWLLRPLKPARDVYRAPGVGRAR